MTKFKVGDRVRVSETFSYSRDGVIMAIWSKKKVKHYSVELDDGYYGSYTEEELRLIKSKEKVEFS